MDTMNYKQNGAETINRNRIQAEESTKQDVEYSGSVNEVEAAQRPNMSNNVFKYL